MSGTVRVPYLKTNLMECPFKENVSCDQIYCRSGTGFWPGPTSPDVFDVVAGETELYGEEEINYVGNMKPNKVVNIIRRT